jgi:hypothetical protein
VLFLVSSFVLFLVYGVAFAVALILTVFIVTLLL